MNDTLRRALFEMQLSEGDLAARLGVDPKTVQRWLEGRLPYSKYRDRLARMLGLDEGELWPEVRGARPARAMPPELAGAYPRRNLIPQEAWLAMFATAQVRIEIVAYSAGFLLRDSRFVQTLANKGSQGLSVAVALGDPDRLDLARAGLEDDDEDGLSESIADAIGRIRPIARSGDVELRLHDVLLYNSLFRVDNEVLVNQHLYGIAAERTPVYHLHKASDEEMFDFYAASFHRIWQVAVPAQL